MKDLSGSVKHRVIILHGGMGLQRNIGQNLTGSGQKGTHGCSFLRLKSSSWFPFSSWTWWKSAVRVQSLARAPPISQCHARRFQMSLNSPSLGVVKWPTGSCWGRRFFFFFNLNFPAFRKASVLKLTIGPIPGRFLPASLTHFPFSSCPGRRAFGFATPEIT